MLDSWGLDYMSANAPAGGIVGGGWAGMGSLTLTNWFRGEKVCKLPRKYGGYFRNEADHRDFVSIGTAAGKAKNKPTIIMLFKVKIINLIIWINYLFIDNRNISKLNDHYNTLANLTRH